MFRASNNHAFTIVELVVVIIILGIISAVAAPKFFDLQDYREIAFKDELVSALRFAQKRAVASGCDIRVEVTNNGFTLYRHSSKSDCGSVPDISSSEIVFHPAGGDFKNLDRPESPSPGTGTVVFDALGRARDNNYDEENDFSNFAGLNITIYAETGCVEVD